MLNKELFTLFSIYLLLILGLVICSTSSPEIKQTHIIHYDTQIVIKDTLVNVKDKTALIIGDSHSANNANGWQKVLCDSTGMKMLNVSVGGKTTYWMLQIAPKVITTKVDYCFIYGGANDMYSEGIKPEFALKNVQKIVDLCNSCGVKCYVLTGFDPSKCTRTNNPNYPARYVKLQKLFLDSIKGATVVDTRVVDLKDCWDVYCHMAPSGHRKISQKIIKDARFRKIK